MPRSMRSSLLYGQRQILTARSPNEKFLSRRALPPTKKNGTSHLSSIRLTKSTSAFPCYCVRLMEYQRKVPLS